MLIRERLDALRAVGLPDDELVDAIPDLTRLITQVFRVASKPCKHPATSILSA
jgi:hypothetical protein